LYFLFLSDSFRHPAEFPAGAFNAALRLALLGATHLRQGFRKLSAGAAQNGKSSLQIAADLFDRHGLRADRLPLRFQKQFGLGENALASGARAFAPGGIKLRRLSGIAAVLDERGGHALTVARAHSRDGHQILHRCLRGQAAFAHLPLDRFR
jgi:hypothetical protein